MTSFYPKSFAAQIEPEFLGDASCVTKLVPNKTNEKSMLFYIADETVYSILSFKELIAKALKHDSSFLPNSDNLQVYMSTLLQENDFKSGLIVTNPYHSFRFANINSWESVEDIIKTADNFSVNDILAQRDRLEGPVFFIVTVVNHNPDYGKPKPFNFKKPNRWSVLKPGLRTYIGNLKTPRSLSMRYYSTNLENNSINVHSSLLPVVYYNYLSILFLSVIRIIVELNKLETEGLTEKEVLENLSLLTYVDKKIINDDSLIYHISNPYLLEGNFLSMSIFQNLLDDPNFKAFSYYKLIITTVSFNEADLKVGRMLGQRYTYHPMVLVNNDTTPQQYWDKVSKNIQEKFMDNLYETKTPLLITVRVKNSDKFKNTVITEVKDKKTRVRTISVKPKSGFFTPFGSSKRSFHTSAVLFDRNYIEPIKTDKSKIEITNCFSTLDIETINIDNTEIPIAISLVVLDYGLGHEDRQKYFYTIDKSRLKYSEGVLIKESLETEVYRMWFRLKKTLTKLASEGSVAIKYIFCHNLGSYDGYFIFKYFNTFL